MAFDANAFLQQGGTVGQVRAAMGAALPYVVLLAREAGQAEGADRDAQIKRAFRFVAQMDGSDVVLYRRELANAMDLGLREFDQIRKEMANALKTEEPEDDGDGLVDTVHKVGGFVNDHLFELIYEPSADDVFINGEIGGKTKFAVRTPEGEFKVVDFMDIDGVRYAPVPPDNLMSSGNVEFPSAIGEAMEVRELVHLIQATIHKYVDVDQFYERLASYYVLFSWLYDCFRTVPYLRALGDYGTGKSRLINVVGAMCFRPITVNAGATVSPVFRTLQLFKGTLVFDEGDFRYSDESQDFIKLLNVGYQKRQGVILRAGSKESDFAPEAHTVFGPKIIATRKEFKDKALESRCLTKRMSGVMTRDDIPLEMPYEFWIDEAVKIRNLLLRYRLAHWAPVIETDTSDIDLSIMPRLNQVTMPLKTIIDDAEMRGEINEFVKRYNRELIEQRGMTAAGKVLEAILVLASLCDNPQDADLTISTIADRTNWLIDYENLGETAIAMHRRGRRPRGLNARRVGTIIRNDLNLDTSEREAGKRRRFKVKWEPDKIQIMQRRFGLDDDVIAGSRLILEGIDEALDSDGEQGSFDAPPADLPEGGREEIPF